MKKIGSYLNILLLISLFILLGCNENESDDCYLLIYKDYTITKGDFESELLAHKKSKEELFDFYIEQFLLLDTALKSGVDQNIEIAKQIKYSQKEYLFDLLKRNESQEYKFKDRHVIKRIKRFKNKVYICDYIWIPRKKRQMCKEINKFMQQGADVNMLKGMDNSGSVAISSSGIRLYESIQVNPGSFVNKVERKIVKLDIGKFCVVKTRGGYNIFKLKSKVVVYKTDEQSIKNTKERNAIAKKIEKGQFWFDRKYLSLLINIDREKLNKIQFSINPIVCSDSVVAIYKQDTITWRNIISNLKNEEERYLDLIRINNRAATIINYLLNKTQGDYRIKNFKDKIVISELITNKLNKEYCTPDSSAILESWFDSLLSARKTNELLDVLVQVGDSLKLDEKTQIKKEIDLFRLKNSLLFEKPKDKRYFFNSRRFPDINSLQLNYALIEKKDLSGKNENKSDVVASTKDWKLTKGDLQNMINDLSFESKQLMTEDGNLLKLVEYIAKNNRVGKNQKDLIINKKYLNTPYYLPRFYIEKSDDYYVPESDSLGSFNDSIITVKKLRDWVSDLPREEKEKFIFVDTQEEALKDLLIQDFWFSKFDDVLTKIISESKTNHELQKIQQDIITKSFLNEKIFVSPFSVSNDNLNLVVLYAIQQLNKKRLESLITCTKKKCDVIFNFDLCDKLGINPQKSKYFNYLRK